MTNLLLARTNDRRKEFALRLALGASRARILGQLLVESVVLTLMGGVTGIAVGLAVFRGLLAIRPERLARIEHAGLVLPALSKLGASSLPRLYVLFNYVLGCIMPPSAHGPDRPVRAHHDNSSHRKTFQVSCRVPSTE